MLMFWSVTDTRRSEKNEMTEEAQRLITAVRQMEESLVDEKANGQYNLDGDDLKISYPLNRCLNFLREKYSALKKLHQERFEQVKSAFLPLNCGAWKLIANGEQSLSKPSSPILRTLNPRLSLSNFLLQHLDPRSHLALTSLRLLSRPWTANSVAFTKSTTDVLNLSK